MKQLSKIIDKISQNSALLSGFMVGAMMLIICYEIFARYFFNRPTTFAYDVTEYLIVYATFMAAPWLLKTRVHVRVTIATQYFSRNIQNAFEMVASIIGLGVCVVMCVEGAIDVWELIRDNVWVMRPFTIPKFITRLPIPYGCFLLSFYFIEQIHDSFVSVKQQKKKINGEVAPSDV